MAEVLFYHLQNQPLEAVLPGLLERCLDRGWRAVVQTSSQERAEALNSYLWTYRDNSFLPHGLPAGEFARREPILIAADEGNANDAEVKFLVDNAPLGEVEPYRRVVIMFDGNDAESVEAARGWWLSVRDKGHEATYWQQDENGRWKEKG